MTVKPELHGLTDRVALCWGTGFGAGYSPVVPGTVGTLVGIPLSLLLHRACFHWSGLGFGAAAGIFLTAATLLFLFGVWAANRMERWWKEKDPSVVVADEVVGYLVASFAIPLSAGGILLTFVLFRIFDIIKPFPARSSEALPRGWGIMTDDLFAGIYANLVARLILHFWRLIY